jgi:hypothetical protein
MRFDPREALSNLDALSRRHEVPRRARAVAIAAASLYGLRWYFGAVEPRYALSTWGLWTIGRLFAAAALLMLACLSTGHALLSRVLRVRARPLLDTIVTSLALGVTAFVLAMYAAGFLGLYGRRLAFALPLVMTAAGAMPLVALAKKVRRGAALMARARTATPVETAIARASAALGAVALVVVYLQCMTPDAVSFDAAWCHLTQSQDYAREGRIVPFVADYARNHPQLASILHTWGFLLPFSHDAEKWMLALHVELVLFVFTLMGVSALARWLLGSGALRSAWTSFFLFPAIFVYSSNIGGAADHVLAFFVPPLVLAMAALLRRMDHRRWVLFGVLAGAAVMTKYQAAFIVAAAGAALGVRWLFAAVATARGRAPDALPARTLATGPLAALATGLLVTLPFFGKNWAFHHNPFYPFMQDVFRSRPTVPNASFLIDQLYKDKGYIFQGTTKEKIVAALEYSYRFPFTAEFNGKVPFFGALFTLTALLLPFLRRARRIWVLSAVAWLTVFLWAYTYRVDRNLQLAVPVLAAVTTAILVRAWQTGLAAKLAVVPLVLFQIAWGADELVTEGGGRIAHALAFMREHDVGKRLAYRTEFTKMRDALPRAAKVVFHNERESLGVDREVLQDGTGAQGLIDYSPISSPRELWQAYRALGVTHVVLRPGHRPTLTKQNDIAVEALLRGYCDAPLRAGGYELYTLPAAPPPELDHPFRALLVGVARYRDGLYDLRSLSAVDVLPSSTIAPPLEPRRDGTEGQIDRADAVLVGPKKPSDGEAAALKASFTEVEHFPGAFILFLRTVKGKKAPEPAARAAR